MSSRLQSFVYWVCCCCLVAQLCPTLVDCSLPASSVHRDSLGKNTWVGCQFLLQGIFPTQGLNSRLLHFRLILYHWAYQGSPYWVFRSWENIQFWLWFQFWNNTAGVPYYFPICIVKIGMLNSINCTKSEHVFAKSTLTMYIKKSSWQVLDGCCKTFKTLGIFLGYTVRWRWEHFIN